MLLRQQWRRARIASALGLSAYLVHVWCAFEYFYHWSHEYAYRETARQTAELFGVEWGGGLWLNYLFTAVWLADNVVSWLKADWWRARRYTIAVNGFLTFMFVNATIVVRLLRALRTHE
jgi:hypothetical protein